MTRRLVVRVSLSAEENADEIHPLLVDETQRAVAEITALRATPPPVVRLDEGTGRLRFTVTCTIERMIDADHAQRELAKRLRARLRGVGADVRETVIDWGVAWREPATLDATAEGAIVG